MPALSRTPTHTPTIRARFLAGCLASLALLTWAEAFALTAAEIDASKQQAERVQREEQERQREQLRRDLEMRGPRTRLPAAPVVTPERGAGPCREIREVRAKGITLLKPATVERITAAYANRCLGVADIEKLLADLTNAYIAQGFVTVRAYLPQQDLSGGILEILVVEGKVEKIQINDGGKGSVSVGNVAPGTVGLPLNLRDFEQALDQINRLASNNATFDIQPGNQPGDSVVVINNSPARAWRAGLTHDNQGSDATGKHQTGLNLSWDNPLGLDDFISVTHRRATPYHDNREASQSNSLTYVVPFGYTTATLSLSDSSYALTTPTSSAAIMRGDSDQAALRLDHVVFRDQTSRWNLAATLTSKGSRLYIADIFIGESSRRLTPIDLDSSYTTGFAGGSLTLDLGYSRGLKFFDALKDSGNLPDTAPRAQFGKWRYGAMYSLPFKTGDITWTFTSALSGQVAEDVLYGSEQFSVGGIHSVRGFIRNTLSGDDGYTLRNDLGVRIPFAGPNGLSASLRPYLALDHGRVHNRAPGVPNGALTGVAVGCSLSLGAVTLDLFHARGLDQPDSMSHESGATFFRFSATI